MNIFGKSVQFWTTEKIRNIESVLQNRNLAFWVLYRLFVSF